MADFQGTFVDTGRALKAANDANGDGTPISYIEAAQGTTAPTRQDSAVETPYVPPRRFASPPGLAIGDSYQFDFVDGTDDAYDPQEFCVFSGGNVANGGGTLMFRFVLANPITKPANTRARYPLVGQIAGEDLTTLDFAVTINSSAVADWTESEAGKVERASQNEAQATSSHSNDKGLSALRGWEQVEAWWGALSKLRLRNKLGMATAQAARAGTGDGVMTSEITAEAIAALTPVADVQTFDASGTWTKPTGAKSVEVHFWNAGQDGNATAGGEGGGFWYASYLADWLPATVAVTVGSRGATPGKSGFGAFAPRGSLNARFGGSGASNQYLPGVGGLGGALTGTSGGDAGSFAQGTLDPRGYGAGEGGSPGQDGSAPGGGGGRNASGADGRVIVVSHFS